MIVPHVNERETKCLLETSEGDKKQIFCEGSEQNSMFRSRQYPFLKVVHENWSSYFCDLFFLDQQAESVSKHYNQILPPPKLCSICIACVLSGFFFRTFSCISVLSLCSLFKESMNKMTFITVCLTAAYMHCAFTLRT